MRWLRRFLHSDDPVVQLAAALSQPEAEIRRDLLEREGVAAMVKSVAGDSSAYGAVPPYGFDLFVKQSDLERATRILDDLLGPDGEPVEEPDMGIGSGNGHAEY